MSIYKILWKRWLKCFQSNILLKIWALFCHCSWKECSFLYYKVPIFKLPAFLTVMKFLYMQKKTSKEINENMMQTLGNKCLSQSTMKKWYANFQCAENSLRGLQGHQLLKLLIMFMNEFWLINKSWLKESLRH